MKTNEKHSRSQFMQILLSCKQWNYEYARDLKSRSGGDYEPGVCEKCGRKGLRILHHVSHKYFKTNMIVGCVCASKMISACDTPFWFERRLINRPKRLETWLKLPWKRSKKGNPYLKKNKHTITVFRDKYNPKAFKICICPPEGETTYSKSSYSKLKDAKLSAFDLLEEKFDKGVINKVGIS